MLDILKKEKSSRRISKRALAGLLSILTSVVGGILSSIGSDLYNAIKGQIQEGSFYITALQIVFVIIGLVGICLLCVDFLERRKNREKASRRRLRK